MKKYIYIFCFALLPLLAAGSFADSTKKSDGDLIVGFWVPEDGRSVIKIYKGTGENGEDVNKYYGKVVWLLEPNDADGNPRKDIENPDESLRDRPLKGLRILQDLEFIEVDGKDVSWDNGKIYKATSGEFYAFEAEINTRKPNEMDAKGSLIAFGKPTFFGISQTWTRKVKK